MFSKRTVIGTIVGGAIIAIGVAAFVLAIGIQVVEINDTFGTGEQTSYGFTAPVGTVQRVVVTGDSFDVEIASPGSGLQVPLTGYKKENIFEWTHAEDGQSKMFVQNTGQTEMQITGVVQISTDPIYFTYHVLVIISGIVIVGFSAGFSIRKPRGF